MITRITTVAMLALASNILLLPVHNAARAGTLGGVTSFSGGWNSTFSDIIATFTRASTTVDGTVIPAPTFDITEGDGCTLPTDINDITDNTSIVCTGSALFHGILKITHVPEFGQAWAEYTMEWPNIKITITPHKVNTGSYTFLTESRTYELTLPTNYTPTPGLQVIGSMRVVPELPTSDYFTVCSPTASASVLTSYPCHQDIGYGGTAFNPTDVFQPITTASGQTIGANTGFYWDEACVAFAPGDLNIPINGTDFDLKEDTDGRFRICEGRSVAFNTCTNPDNAAINCNNLKTFVLADAAAGDRLEPAPTVVYIGTDVTDWLQLGAYTSGEKLAILPKDPNQGYIQLPWEFSATSLTGSQSELDKTSLSGYQIVSISGYPGLPLELEEVPDRSPNLFDFRGINMDGITLVDSGENDDEIFASDRGTVLLGGNGDDKLHGGAGPDCLVGEKNDDESWGGLGKNVFVVLSKSANGKDTIHDFQGLDADGPVDTIVNLSGNSMSKEGPYTDSSGSYYLLSLNGQNYIKVYGGEPVLGAGGNVDESATNLDDYSQCKGWNP